MGLDVMGEKVGGFAVGWLHASFNPLNQSGKNRRLFALAKVTCCEELC